MESKLQPHSPLSTSTVSEWVIIPSHICERDHTLVVVGIS
jgi:hypothetical protein